MFNHFFLISLAIFWPCPFSDTAMCYTMYPVIPKKVERGPEELVTCLQGLSQMASPNGHWDTVEIKVQPWQRTNPNIANISDCSDNISLILWFSLFHCQAGVPSLQWIIGWMIYQKQSLKPPINCTFVDPTCHENIWKTPAICTIRITLLGDHQDIPLRSWKKDSKNDVVSLQYKKTWNTYTFLNFLGKPYWVFQNC